MPTLLCASALAAVVSFLASVYLVRKKSSHSFFTALLGAVGNILLNLLLIPRMGPLGAAIATLASYALVMAVRLNDAPRFVRFHRCLPRLCVGTGLLVASAAVMTLDVSGRIWWALGLTVVNVAVNAPALLLGMRQMPARRKTKN
jgi:O-antigen/teichoic acid export membrane protein